MRATLASLWSDHSQRRLEWAQTAYAEFLSSIAPELAAQYRNHQEEVTVAVFGKTQVGKTTLILQLMGLTTAAMPIVSQVLRGGRAKGRSATSTAMLYSRSLDSSWHLTVEGETTVCESAADMEQALGELRHTMESGRLKVTRPVQVHMPSELFTSTGDASLAVNIIDLPGDSPANEAEQAHVSHVASQFIPNADLVLLVGKADDLGFLDPEKLVLPVLGDWRYSPSRFRLITTFTIQSTSFREWLSTQKKLDASAIRRRLLTQLETFDDIELPSDALNPALYFPLEFGDSWEVLKTTSPQIYADVQPVMSGLLDDLKRDIQYSATPHMRLWRATQVHVVANRVKRSHEKQARAAIEKTIEVARTLEARSQSLLQTSKTLLGRAEALPTHVEIERFVENLRKLAERLMMYLPSSAPYEDKRVSAFLEALNENINALVRRGQNFEPPVFEGFEPSMYAPSPSTVRGWLDSHLDGFRQRLNAYKLDAYQPWLFKSFEQDVEEFNRLCREASERLRACLQVYWQDTIHRLGKAWDLERLTLREQAEVAKNDATNLSIKAQGLKQVADRQEAELQVFVSRLERDEATGARFVSLLEQAYDQQVRKVTATYLTQDTPATKFVILLALRQLQDEKHYLFSLGHADKESSQ
ncbi:hypothetical protein [Hydrogenophaga atypica]|uniref:Dynamin family protein n=1 Tax=Hydrogenophaga atypica TaxID=249409 RepID=A0ABW2QPR8_9BURK